MVLHRGSHGHLSSENLACSETGRYLLPCWLVMVIEPQRVNASMGDVSQNIDDSWGSSADPSLGDISR